MQYIVDEIGIAATCYKILQTLPKVHRKDYSIMIEIDSN